MQIKVFLVKSADISNITWNLIEFFDYNQTRLNNKNNNNNSLIQISFGYFHLKINEIKSF